MLLKHCASYVVLLGLPAMMVACADDNKSNSSDDDPIPDGKGRILGLVVDADGVGIEAVDVAAGKTSVQTDPSGQFSLDIAPGTVLLHFSKSGYTEAAVSVPVTEGAPVPVEEGLLQRSAPVTLDIDAGGTVGTTAKAVLAAGALVDSEGTPASGEISAYITPIDIMADLRVAPGDFSAESAAGEETNLETFAMADYYFEDADGNALNVADGQTVTVEMPIDASLNASEGDQIPAWSFDMTTGKWKEEGVGEVVKAEDGTLVWRAEVGHFSWWNADVPIDERDCVSGTVVDCNGDPVPGASVKAMGIDYRGETGAYPDAAGTFCFDIKRGGSVEVTAIGSVNGNLVGRRTQLTGADRGASCDEGSGCTTLDIALPCDPDASDLDCRDSALLPCDSCISGRVVDENGDPVAKAVVTLETVADDFRASTTTRSDGTFDVTAPLDAEARLVINATGYPPNSVAVTATQEGQCPNGEDVGDITLSKDTGNDGTGNLFADCNQGEVDVTATDLDGAASALESFPYAGMVIMDIMGYSSGYLWFTDATDADNLDGTSSIFITFSPENIAEAGTAELAGTAVSNSGGVVGVNSEYYTVENGVINWEAASGGTLTGTVSFDLVTICGMALRTVHYEGTFSTTVLDLMVADNADDACFDTFPLLMVSFEFLTNFGMISMEVDGLSFSFADILMAGYYPSSGSLVLQGYDESGTMFSLSQDLEVGGTQNIAAVSFSESDMQCYYQASDVPTLTIDTTDLSSFSEGPLTGSFTATLPEMMSCDTAKTSIDISGSFQAAVCN